MAQMAKAAMDQMRQERNPKPSPMTGKPMKTSQLAKSTGGAASPEGDPPGKVGELVALKKGDWGKLPPKMAEDLAKAQKETLPAEYREAIEAYYRVVAERSKKTSVAPVKAQP
jgi:hypothetical protein